MQLRAWIAVAVIGVGAYAWRRGEAPAVEPAKLEAPARIDRAVAATPRPSLAVREVVLEEIEADEPDEVPAVVVEKPLPQAGRNTVHGRMRDAETGELLAGVTIVATSPVLEQVQTAITDEDGYYRITELPTGEYKITVYYLDKTLEHAGVWVGSTAAIVEDDIDSSVRGEAMVVRITEEE